ncbi:hypothetical protein [Hymenobacter sp. YC55]|uniref:hypothetical protein n=1 Tax=Hymenobacter sp. YC55 TaxID=3034019 RepID=UPI0023F8A21B|nr:hypothetical protein [Hymenobacter sp. YC55]MDF7810739.1 hypothetical protein [Hymenobacter sp. YC55]
METTVPTMRQLMPEGYIAELAVRTGMSNPSNIVQLVKREQTTSKHWPAVKKLALETNPEGLSQWEAAHLPQQQAA